LGTQAPAPASGVEQSQGVPYDPATAAALQVPQSMGLNLKGFVNPFNLTLYSFPLSTSQPTRVMPANYRRCYLLIQNQGLGNVWINFGQDVTAATSTSNSNGLLLVNTQTYEQIGGGDVDLNTDQTRAYCFVSPNYLSAILIGEGVWQYNYPPGYST
jgi:hypothetical protein